MPGNPLSSMAPVVTVFHASLALHARWPSVLGWWSTSVSEASWKSSVSLTSVLTVRL